MRESEGLSAAFRLLLVLVLAVAGVTGLVEEKPVISVPMTPADASDGSVVFVCSEPESSNGNFCCKGGLGQCRVAARPTTLEEI